MRRLTLIAVLLLALVGHTVAANTFVAVSIQNAPAGGGTDPVSAVCSTTGLLPLKVHDLLIAHLVSAYGGTTTFTVTPPSGWTLWPGYPNTSQLAGTETMVSNAYYSYYNGGTPKLTWTVSDGSGTHNLFYTCRIWQWRGTNLATVNDGNASKAATQSATTVTAPSVTAATGDTLLALFGADSRQIAGSGSPALTQEYQETAVIGAWGGYLLAPSAGATTAYVGTCQGGTCNVLVGEELLIKGPPVLSTSVLFNSCASTGCSGTPLAKTWAFDPLAQLMKLESDGVWAAMP